MIPEEEEEERTTFFQRNSLLTHFTYETPFSKSGKIGQTHTAEQWMKRTILVTEHSFPYALKRVPVRSRRDVVISPIEIAIEAMQGRTEKLRLEVIRKPPDVKTLQQVLQGSVLTTVNRGIIEYLEIFLANPSDYNKSFIKSLQAKFKEFFLMAENALSVNRSIITKDQSEFQKEMENGYKELRKLADPLLVDEDEPDDFGDSTGNSSSPRSFKHRMGSSDFVASPVASPRLSPRSQQNSPRLGARARRGSTRDKESHGVSLSLSRLGGFASSSTSPRHLSPRSPTRKTLSKHMEQAVTADTGGNGEEEESKPMSVRKKVQGRLSKKSMKRASSSSDLKKRSPQRTMSTTALDNEK